MMHLMPGLHRRPNRSHLAVVSAALVAGLMVAVTGALSIPSVGPAAPGNVWLVVTLAVVVVTVAVAVPVRRRARWRRVKACLDQYVGPASVAARRCKHGLLSSPEATPATQDHPTTTRATQIHVVTLEKALDEQSRRVVDLERELAEERAKGGHDDVLRMLVTVKALRDGVDAGPTGEEVLDRVETAILRLASDDMLARVDIPAAPATPAPPAALVGAAPPGDPVDSVTTEAIVDEEGSTSRPEQVLPVPPPPAEQARVRRGWRRRSVA